MKRILYVSLICVFCFIVSCQAFWTEDVPMPGAGSKKENRLTVEDIKARFAKVEPQLIALTRAANNEISIIPNDFSPQWDCSIWSSDRETESIEVMIGGSTKFVAQWDASEIVGVHQRILVTSDSQDSLPSIGIETLIPTPEFYALHPEDFDQHFVNCDWRKRDFSGIILLHQFDGLLSRIVRVDNGLFVASYSAYNDWVSDDYQRVESEVDFMMSGVKIYNSASIVALSRVVIDVDPVIVIGTRPCGHCFKRICQCDAFAEELKSWLEFQNNDLYLGDGGDGGDGGGGGGGDGGGDGKLRVEDSTKKDTTTSIDVFVTDTTVNVDKLKGMLDALKLNCLGNYLLELMSSSKINISVSASIRGFGQWDGKTITIRKDIFEENSYAKYILIHEMFHAYDKDRTRSRADREMQAHLFTNIIAGKTFSTPGESADDRNAIDKLMRNFTDNYVFNDMTQDQYNNLYSDCYQYIDDKYKNTPYKKSDNTTLSGILNDSGCLDIIF